ncbi:3-carboxy-cis,cis-muconate cycloisomerase [Acidovorax sp. SUPP1855]|uniref:tripartite tricarboxylate transporter substrate-binding protein n=1 Tax=Acidovorax sp. SUPP1855 TaxID=431774 RepID=UPI0023DE4EDC|nr:tripartite tricarboxylate transporter substrate-binding protein [Acidovorax sp. SUPP1855]GKS87361.1 3-carboxy-cis,cis-muconate cycloisomerase [Acidovorax sp. SUPP1855]
MQPSTFRRAAVALAAATLAFAAQAQGYPAKPLTWIVPFAAGGPTDAMARDIAQRTSTQLGQQIIIENTPGAGGTIGSAKAARAPADGYTFLVGHMGYMGAAPSLYKKLAYDPVKDFDAVFRFPDTPLVLLVGKNSPYKTAEDLIAYGQQNPGKLNFGNAGVGSTSHLVAALFASRAKVEITSVSYKGAAPAMTDLVAGQVDAMFDQTNTALPQLAGERVRAVALTSDKAMPQFPGVPPLGQKVIPGFETATWYGIYAPKGTPREAIQKVYQAYTKALADKAWTDKMAAQGIRMLPDDQYTPDALARHTATEVERWRKVAAEARISLD